MTKEKFFETRGPRYIYISAADGVYINTVEEIYQAFKSRLKAEAVLNVWPEEE